MKKIAAAAALAACPIGFVAQAQEPVEGYTCCNLH
jgi:hypothetical protein